MVFSVLLGLIIMVGVLPILNLIFYILPTYEAPIKIIGRDTHESYGFIARGAKSSTTAYFIIAELNNGKVLKVSCPIDCYRSALPGLRVLSRSNLKLSVLADYPVELSIESKIQSLLPTIFRDRSKTKQTDKKIYNLLMPFSGALILSILIWGFIGYFLWKVVPNKKNFSWELFSIIGFCFASIGVYWSIF